MNKEKSIPTIAIVGRPNVGKSTLFNRLVGRRTAIVDDRPGVTIDRNYALVNFEGRQFWVIDTGGFEPAPSSALFAKMRAQAELALSEADAVIFLLDSREGLTPDDYEVAEILRKSGKPFVAAVNKIDSQKQEERLMPEFFAIGVEELMPVSAAHGRGIAELIDRVFDLLPEQPPESDVVDNDEEVCRIAIIGRPNAGKSTLVNSILGEERVVVDDTPGTTRDSINIPFERNNKRYLIVDTAGVRRRARIKDFLERLTVMRALRAIENSDVVVLMLDAQEPATDQDAKLAGFAERRGRGLVIAVNKWDLLEKNKTTASEIEKWVREKLYFVSYAPIVFISALTGRRVGKLLDAVDEVFANYTRRVGTGEINRWLQQAKEAYQPPPIQGKRLKLLFATQVATKPPTIVIKTNTTEKVPTNYERYLINSFRKHFAYTGVPIKIIFRHRQEEAR